MEITEHRRAFQKRYNKIHGITPQTIIKKVSLKEGTIKGIKHMAKTDVQRQIIEFDAEMREAAERLDFERAIQLRDAIREMSQSLDLKEKNEQKT
jgi:excinuclease ABC subunit B